MKLMKGEKKLKRVISVFLSVMMMMSLVACSGGGGSDGGIPTLTWYISGEPQPDQQTVIETVNEILVEKIGAKLDIKFISEGAYREKIDLMAAAREEFDLCFTGYNYNYVSAVNKGALYDITDLIDKTELRKVLPKEIFEIASVDGRIYGIPNQQIFALPMALVVRKDLAEKYNLDMSGFTKTTDIEPFLETIKQNEPDYIPFSAYHKLNSIHTIDGTKNYTNSYIEIEKVGENDWEAVMPDYSKENNATYIKSKQMNDWYKKGYIRKDVDVATDDTAELASGKYAVTMATYKPGVEAELASQVSGEVVVKVVGPTYYELTYPLATMISVSATTKHPEKCVELISLLNTDADLYNMICYGLEGKHYTKTGENRIELIENSGYNPNACWKFGNNFNAFLLPLQPDDTHEQCKEINATSEILGIPGFVFDSTNVKTELLQVSTVMDKYKALQLGSVDPDAVWDAYSDEMKKAGILKIYEEMARQINEHEKTL